MGCRPREADVDSASYIHRSCGFHTSGQEPRFGVPGLTSPLRCRQALLLGNLIARDYCSGGSKVRRMLHAPGEMRFGTLSRIYWAIFVSNSTRSMCPPGNSSRTRPTSGQ